VPNEPIQEASKDQAVAWFLRLQSDHVSAKERHEFLHWLNENPQHKQAYDKVGHHWEWLEPLKNLHFIARQEALKYQAPRPYYRRITTYAAAALIVCAVGLSVYWQQVGLIFPKTYQVAIGERQAIQLADGTRMDLNTDSAVKVQITPWRRDVELLRGEVYFQVAHDNKRPFQVKAGRGLIQDIGTAFEVYRQPGKTLVAVQEGIVDVATKERRRLTANQQLAYTDNGEFLSLEQQAIDSLTAWRHGQLVFNARRLDDALAEIARYHSKQIRLEDNTLAALRISGAFPSARLDSMLNAVTRILPVCIVQHGEAIVIRRAGKPKA
jgi:transmembrane sensor